MPYTNAVDALVIDLIAAPIEAEYAARFARDHQAAQAGCPVAAKAFREAGEAIEEIIPARHRSAELIMLAVGGATVRGVAESMRIDRPTAKLRLNRALIALAIHYRRIGDAPSPSRPDRPGVVHGDRPARAGARPA